MLVAGTFSILQNETVCVTPQSRVLGAEEGLDVVLTVIRIWAVY